MPRQETTDCTLEQWHTRIKHDYEKGKLVIMVPSSRGLFPLGALPNDPNAERLQIISFDD